MNSVSRTDIETIRNLMKTQAEASRFLVEKVTSAVWGRRKEGAADPEGESNGSSPAAPLTDRASEPESLASDFKTERESDKQRTVEQAIAENAARGGADHGDVYEVLEAGFDHRRFRITWQVVDEEHGHVPWHEEWWTIFWNLPMEVRDRLMIAAADRSTVQHGDCDFGVLDEILRQTPKEAALAEMLHTTFDTISRLAAEQEAAWATLLGHVEMTACDVNGGRLAKMYSSRQMETGAHDRGACRDGLGERKLFDVEAAARRIAARSWLEGQDEKCLAMLKAGLEYRKFRGVRQVFDQSYGEICDYQEYRLLFSELPEEAQQAMLVLEADRLMYDD